MRYKDLSGLRFGKLLILRRSDGNNGRVSWECLCDCGEVSNPRSCDLLSGRSKSCGCSKAGPPPGPREYRRKGCVRREYVKHRADARLRKIECNLTQQQFENLVLSDCHYCKSAPSRLKKNGDESELLGGIDRIDSSKGYVLENCVACCSVCNYMKRCLSVQDFLNQVEKIFYANNLHQSNANR